MAHFKALFSQALELEPGENVTESGYIQSVYGTLKPSKLYRKTIYQLTFNTSGDQVILDFGDAGGEQYGTAGTVTLQGGMYSLPDLVLTWDGTRYLGTSAAWTDYAAAVALAGGKFLVRATPEPEPQPLPPGNTIARIGVNFNLNDTEPDANGIWQKLNVANNSYANLTGFDGALTGVALATSNFNASEQNLSGGIANRPYFGYGGAVNEQQDVWFGYWLTNTGLGNEALLTFSGLPANTTINLVAGVSASAGSETRTGVFSGVGIAGDNLQLANTGITNQPPEPIAFTMPTDGSGVLDLRFAPDQSVNCSIGFLTLGW